MHYSQSGRSPSEDASAVETFFLVDQLQNAEHYFRVVEKQHLLMRQLREAQRIENRHAEPRRLFVDDGANFDGGDVWIDD
jgi:hypothetical protein